MVSYSKLRELSFLVYGLGLTGKSVIKFFKKNKIKKFKVWDDNNTTLFKNKRAKNIAKTLNDVDYIILSPGVSLLHSKNKNQLINHKNKIITDLDLIFLLNNYFKCIVVTGTNGKSSTCKILSHLLKQNKFKVLLGGNIGKPVLNLKVKKIVF